MNVLVTGGAGYIGTSLVEQLSLLDSVEIIYVLDNLSRSPLAFFIGDKKLQKVKFVKGDILDSYVLDKLIDKVDIVYHLAGYVSSPYNYAQNIQYEQINQWGTLNLIRCIQQSTHTISQFIYLSSVSVYGLRGIVSTLDEPQPTNAYGKSKFAGEKFVSLLLEECKVNIIRAANVFGFNNNFRIDSVLNNFVFHGIVDNKILIYGDGTQQRPFVSLKKCVRKLVDALYSQSSDLIIHAVEFNSDLNKIKSWLLENYLPELEFTYINPGIEYEGQYMKNASSEAQMPNLLEESFLEFQSNIRISGE